MLDKPTDAMRAKLVDWLNAFKEDPFTTGGGQADRLLALVATFTPDPDVQSEHICAVCGHPCRSVVCSLDCGSKLEASTTPDPVQSDGEELREAWLYLHKWVERGLFDSHTTPKNALECIAHHPTAPWKNGRWDVDHKPYAEAFYAAFPKARLTSLSAPVEKD